MAFLANLSLIKSVNLITEKTSNLYNFVYNSFSTEGH